VSVTLRSIVLCVAFAAACAPTVPPSDSPAWLTKLIADLEAQPVENPPAHIARYSYKGQTVYYLPSHCCDVRSTVFNAAGSVICSADGGMTGKGDGRCPDFFAERRDEEIIWRDTRSAR
jgi:hypothetical protein